MARQTNIKEVKVGSEPPVHLMPGTTSGFIQTDKTPNVVFIGTRRRNGKEKKSTEAPKKLISGPDTFRGLPSSDEQIKGFYYKRAAELCRAFPGLYKRLIRKGE